MDRLMRKAARVLTLMAADVLRRVRRRGRSALFRAARMTGATVAAFLIAELVGLRTPPPLIAALTALLVVQTTLASTLATGVERVLSVVAGVTLAVLFVSVVGLTWWSLGALVAASIVVGQVLRLGSNLVEVPISAMLVLGVGYSAGAQAVGAGRVVETLLGAAVGVLVNVLFPPAVQTRYAGQAVETFAEEIAGLLDTAASALSAGAVTEEEAARWLEDARRLTREAPRGGRPRGGWGPPAPSTGTRPGWPARWPMPRRAAGSTCAPSVRLRSVRGCARAWMPSNTARCRCGPCSAPSTTRPESRSASRRTRSTQTRSVRQWRSSCGRWPAWCGRSACCCAGRWRRRAKRRRNSSPGRSKSCTRAGSSSRNCCSPTRGAGMDSGN